MKRGYAVVAVALIPIAAATMGAFEGEVPPTKVVMKTLFKKGNDSKSSILKTQTEATPPDWSAIQRTTKEFATLGSALEKNEPPKGAKDSWAKLTTKLAANTKALDEAAGAKNLAAIKASQKALGSSCMECHNAHRGR